MAILQYNEVGIIGIAACVPKNVSKNEDLVDLIPKEEIDKVINSIGIKEKRFVEEGVTPSDLCVAAAERLLSDLEVSKEEIDVLIFLSQNGDYKIPATAPSLQKRLGLSTNTACFDLSLACSGYVYALSTAFAYASQPTVNKVLLLVGETFSQLVSPKDKVNAPLYGDAGTATLLGRGDFGPSQFMLFSDGSGVDSLKIKSGGARYPFTCESSLSVEREEGNFRSDLQLYMDGMDVFNFTLKVVPSSVKSALEQVGKTVDDFDFFIFHQANKFMIDFFVKKLKINPAKVPISLDTFGNVSSATIPLTIVSRLADSLKSSRKEVVLSGFGAGLSWATAVLSLNNCEIVPLIEFE
jgi:3-oxoacyl-[acyl-carrier-protein] synthase-3